MWLSCDEEELSCKLKGSFEVVDRKIMQMVDEYYKQWMVINLESEIWGCILYSQILTLTNCVTGCEAEFSKVTVNALQLNNKEGRVEPSLFPRARFTALPPWKCIRFFEF